MESPWFTGQANVPTFKPDELIASKFRALFQRDKGRDLFDLWFTMSEGMVDPERLLACFDEYTANLAPPITRARFEKNLSKKVQAGDFGEDIEGLLAPAIDYDINEAINLVHEELIQQLEGDPYQGDDNIFVEADNE
jgi:predicted nucleotidyltransferase component of viral defense system